MDTRLISLVTICSAKFHTQLIHYSESIEYKAYGINAYET